MTMKSHLSLEQQPRILDHRSVLLPKYRTAYSSVIFIMLPPFYLPPMVASSVISVNCVDGRSVVVST